MSGKRDSKADALYVDITPEMASLWLGLNYDGQRKVKPSIVAKYAREMAAGEWRGANGQSITFADGVLVDGQHRLHAVIKAGVPVRMLVVHTDASPEDIMATIDVGDKRTAAQLYHGPHAAVVCAIGRFEVCMVYGSQGLHGCCQGRLSGGSHGVRVVMPTAREVLEHVEENEERLQRLACLALKMYSSNSTGAPFESCRELVALATFCGRDEALDEFCEDFASVASAQPALSYAKAFLVRQRLGSARTLSPIAALDVLLRAYDAFCDGETVKVFKPGALKTFRKWDALMQARRAEL